MELINIEYEDMIFADWVCSVRSISSPDHKWFLMLIKTRGGGEFEVVCLQNPLTGVMIPDITSEAVDLFRKEAKKDFVAAIVMGKAAWLHINKTPKEIILNLTNKNGEPLNISNKHVLPQDKI